MSDEQFEEFVDKAIDNLPDENLKNLDNVAIVIEDWPTQLQLKKGEVKRGTLFGLYEGIPKPTRGNSYSFVAPDKITIFKGPLTRVAVNKDHLQLLVNNTVWHEVAHHYGLGHGRINELEKKAQTRRQFAGKVEYEKSKLLEQANITHGWFKRRGGVSQAPFASLNVAHGNGDRSEFVEENIRRAATELNLDRDRLVHHANNLHHKDKVFQATAKDAGKIVSGADIIMTDVADLPIALNTADCMAILFYEPKKKVVAISHAGWRGAELSVASKTIQELGKRFGAKAQDLIVAIGPSAGKSSYEVGKEVASKFASKFVSRESDRLLLDVAGVVEEQIREAGVNCVDVSKTDTIRDEDYFSYRRERITGRNFNVISL